MDSNGLALLCLPLIYASEPPGSCGRRRVAACTRAATYVTRTGERILADRASSSAALRTAANIRLPALFGILPTSGVERPARGSRGCGFHAATDIGTASIGGAAFRDAPKFAMLELVSLDWTFSLSKRDGNRNEQVDATASGVRD